MARVITESFEGGHLFRFGNQVGTNGSAVVGRLIQDFNLNPPVGQASAMDELRALECNDFDTRLTMALPAATEYFIGFFFIAEDPSYDFNANVFQSGTNRNHRILIWADSGGNVLGYVRINPLTQKLELYIGDLSDGAVLASTSSQAQVITSLTLYHIQIHVTSGGISSNVQVKLDDILVIDWTGTMGGSNIAQLQWAGPGRNFADSAVDVQHYFDTIIVNDTTVATCAADSTWPGVLRLKTQLVAGPGTYSQFTPQPTQANYLNVDDLPNDGDTTYNYALSSGLKDSFPTSPHGLLAANVTFRAWFQEVIARKNSGTFQIRLGVRRAGVDYLSATASNVGVSYDVFDERRCLDPSSLTAWSGAGLDSTEIIYQVD